MKKADLLKAAALESRLPPETHRLERLEQLEKYYLEYLCEDDRDGTIFDMEILFFIKRMKDRHKEDKRGCGGPRFIYETALYCGRLKEWRVANLNTATIYTVPYETEEDALASIEEGEVRDDSVVKKITWKELRGTI